MTAQAKVDRQPQTGPGTTPGWQMLVALGGIATVSGLLVALAAELAAPIIAENQRIRTEQAVFQVVAGAVSKRDFVVTAKGLEPAAPGMAGEPVYAAYDSGGQLKGIAITGVGSGYGGPVKVLFNYDPLSERIVASKVLQSTETPGFGNKLDEDPEFLKNMKALDARLNADGTALANAIVIVKHGTKTQPWEIDAISGATISSKAMGKAANAAAQRAAPAIRRDLSKLVGPTDPPL